MLIVARASHLPHTPRKLKLVADAVRGKDANKMLEALRLTPQRASVSLIKLISQALGNAKNNFNLTDKSFIIKEIFVTEGRRLKRHRIGSRGRYKPYAKLTSHLTVKLQAKERKVKVKVKGNKLLKPKNKNGTKS